MTAGVYNATIEQGATFERTFGYYQADGVTLVNLTGWSGKLIAVEDGAVVFESGVTAGVTVTLGGVAGTVLVALTAAATLAFDFTKAAWKLSLTDPTGKIHWLWKGTATLDRDETVV